MQASNQNVSTCKDNYLYLLSLKVKAHSFMRFSTAARAKWV